MNNFSRRKFVKSASMGAGFFSLHGVTPMDGSIQEEQYHNPREVLLATMTMDRIGGKDIHEVIQSALRQMENALPMSPDIYCLPEAFHSAGVQGGRPSRELTSENGSGNIISPFQNFARTHRCYIICPIYTVEHGKYYNAAVIIDRQGKYLGEYRKARLTEGELNGGLTPGPLDIPVFDLDFGRIGIQICFDIEWPEGWIQLQRKGAEIVFFPSAFSGGKRLNAIAMENRYCVVTSTRDGYSKICDVMGELAASGGHGSNKWGVCARINLERAILHTHSAGTVASKYPEIRKKYGRKLELKIMGEENYTIMESVSPDVKVADVMKEFDLRSYQRHLQIPDEIRLTLGFPVKE